MIYVKCLHSLLLLKFLDAQTKIPRTNLILQKETISVPDVIRYGTTIHAKFTYPSNHLPKEYDWVAIFPDSDIPLDEYYTIDETFWAHTCGSQDKGCSKPYPTNGVVTFSVLDPNKEYEQQWPLKEGDYRVCLAGYADNYYQDDDSTGVEYEVIGLCKRFSIEFKESDKELLRNEAKVAPTKKTFEYEEPVIAHFKTPKQIENTWLGIYNKEDRDTNGPLSTELMWVYTGCDNVDGDQNESNDCARQRREGTSWFNYENTGYASVTWPLPPGNYSMVLVFENNHPHEVFKWSAEEDSFEVLPTLNS